MSSSGDTPAAPTRRITLPGGDEDLIAVEEPLEIRVEGKAAAVTMRTPGDDLDLAIGFLTTEGVLGPDDAMSDVKAMAQVSENVVDVRLSEGVSPTRARSADREFFATSSCGICGKASIERILRGRRDPLHGVEPGDGLLGALPATFDAAQLHTHTTGCMHAAALFRADDPGGTILMTREDVGRHNAVDKVIGAWIRERAGPGDTHVYPAWPASTQPGALAFAGLGLVVTSRAGFEVVQKAITVGIGLVCTVGAPTSLAVELATESGCVLISWVRPGRARRYTRPQ